MSLALKKKIDFPHCALLKLKVVPNFSGIGPRLICSKRLVNSVKNNIKNVREAR